MRLMGENLLIKWNLRAASRLASMETKDLKSSNQISFENSIASHSNIVCSPASILIENLARSGENESSRLSSIFQIGKIYCKHFFESIRSSLWRK